MEKYLEQITPNVSDVWRTDELYLKVKGNMKYLYALMDDETRFWIAKQVSDSKNSANVRPLFQQRKQRTGMKPSVLISDAAPNFHEAYKKEFLHRRILEPNIDHLSDYKEVITITR
jgi:putative transposase